MQTAYVLISCDPKDVYEIIAMLNNITGILEANMVEGPYDILVKIAAENSEKLKEIISIQLGKMDAIKHRLTLTAV